MPYGLRFGGGDLETARSGTGQMICMHGKAGAVADFFKFVGFEGRTTPHPPLRT